MARGLLALLLCQLIGTIIQQAIGIPVPGPVLGLLLLLAVMIKTGGPSAEVQTAAQGLLKYLGLLFVPAGVGVLTQLPALRDNALAILVAIPVSTVLALLVTGWLMQRLARGAA